MSIISLVLYRYNQNYYFKHNLLSLQKIRPDERKYKTNLIQHQLNDYDSILLGASSTTFINENAFNGLRVYNYSVSGMIPSEYQSAISHLEANNEAKIENVFVALSFFTANQNEVSRIRQFHIGNYISESQSVRTVMSELFNFSALTNVIMDLFSDIEHETYYMKGENIHYANSIPAGDAAYRITQGLSLHEKKLREFQYYENYSSELISFRNNNRGKNFFIFIDPVTKPYLDLVLRTQYDQYERWLRETVDVFGHVYIYPYENKISDNYLINFRDNRHYIPSVGTLTINSILNEHDNSLVSLEASNINEFFDALSLHRNN